MCGVCRPTPRAVAIIDHDVAVVLNSQRCARVCLRRALPDRGRAAAHPQNTVGTKLCARTTCPDARLPERSKIREIQTPHRELSVRFDEQPDLSVPRSPTLSYR